MANRKPDYSRALGVTLVMLMLNAGLAFVKLLAGLLGHSYALVADAVESMLDIFSSLIVWGGLQIATRPADENYPYGYGKAEPLAALAVAMMLIGAAIGIAVQAVREIITPHHAPAKFTLWVLLGVVLLKEAMFRICRKVADRNNSTAVLADAWHHRSDAITSTAAALGITIALLGGEGYEPADDWAALFASGVILFNAWRLTVTPLQEILERVPTEMISTVRSLAGQVQGVRGVEKVLARKSGLHYWVDMHIEVEPSMSVHDAHTLSHEVKDVIRTARPEVREVLIHIEPCGGSLPEPQPQ